MRRPRDREKKKFAKLFELAELLGGEVGATRPVVYGTGRTMTPWSARRASRSGHRFYFPSGSAAPSSTPPPATARNDRREQESNATMIRLADVAIVADANQICTTLIAELKRRIRS